MTESNILFALLRHQICGEQVNDEIKQSLTPELLEKIYHLANSHDLAHLVGQALSQLGLLGEDEISRTLKGKAMQAAYRYVQFSYEYERICTALEKAKIPFIPLKGSVLRAYYPEPWMRTSGDIDVLVKPENLDAAIAVLVDQLDYQVGKKSIRDISMYSKTGYLLELHYEVLEEYNAKGKRHQMLERLWDYAAPREEGSCHNYLSDDMFYFYHIAHMAKHFKEGGCGIRTFMDLWIMSHKMEFEADKRQKILVDGNLKAFADAAEALTENWFSGTPMNPLTSQMAQYVLWGGTYGNLENKTAVGQAEEGSKLRYLLRRAFLPYSTMAELYPVLQKHKWLILIYHPVRWLEMFFRGDIGRTMKEMKYAGGISTNRRDAMAQMLQELDM